MRSGGRVGQCKRGQRACAGRCYSGSAGDEDQHQGRQEKAIRAYTDFLRRFPSHPFAFEAWMQLGELNLDTSRIPPAILAFRAVPSTSGRRLPRSGRPPT